MGRGPVGEPAIIRYVNNSLASVTDVSNTDGAMILIKTLTASSDNTLSFVNGASDVVLDSTYPIYLFKFINIHPSAEGGQLTINFRDGGSAYDATKTSTVFQAHHKEDGSQSALAYNASKDVAQGTGTQILTVDGMDDNDSSISGFVALYNPSSTTFVKHFMGDSQGMGSSTPPTSMQRLAAGYVNVTAAIDGVQFAMSSGNIDAGTIKLYGIKDS